MNYAQFGLFIFLVFSVLSAGISLRSFVISNSDSLHRSILVGEALLIGSIVLYGTMMIASMLGLYKVQYLWGLVALNYAFLFNRSARKDFLKCITKKISWDIPLVVFILLTTFFIFRNCYFLVDVDSHSTYLFTQKIWLANGSSLIGNEGYDVRYFIPQFDALFYGLGLSIFGQDTLFPELINLFWRLIVLLLVFGYTSYRFNRYYGLAACMLVLFNDHFFYSGANSCCIINAALIAFIFAAGYNFWEAKSRNDPSCFFMALIFLSQFMSNKYQAAYILLFMFVLGVLIQPDPINRLKEVFLNKKWIGALFVAYLIAALWYIKNWIVTGVPTFPILAGQFTALGWSPEMESIFRKLNGGLNPMQFLKFMNYLFIWPGVTPAKYIAVIISFFPIIILVSNLRKNVDKNETIEACYWLGISIFLIMGICLASHLDPRYYRYPIAVLAFATIFLTDYIFRHCFSINKKFVLTSIVLILALPGFGIMTYQGGHLKRPFYSDNINILMNKSNRQDIIKRYYPESLIAVEEFKKNPEKTKHAAWDKGVGGVTRLSAFLLPLRPQVGMWYTTIVKWDSYKDEKLIVKDLKEHGIEWIMRVKNDKLIFISPEEYAHEAVNYDMYPEEIFNHYNFPKELYKVRY